ncbi:MAG TPA: hypothetical protein VMA36_13550 [Candidatus Limnocylindria bacterium]|nr:hypothetical protein [Candidatus Limnocylindria bacterium]
MIRPRVLVIIALLVVLVFHPWTWGGHPPTNLGPTLIALAVIALVGYACAIKLGDLPSPLRRAPRKPRERTASDVTRAAEELLRAHRRRRN